MQLFIVYSIGICRAQRGIFISVIGYRLSKFAIGAIVETGHALSQEVFERSEKPIERPCLFGISRKDAKALRLYCLNYD
jgi:hypothetical protein